MKVMIMVIALVFYYLNLEQDVHCRNTSMPFAMYIYTYDIISEIDVVGALIPEQRSLDGISCSALRPHTSQIRSCS
jgi:hypothetical protein